MRYRTDATGISIAVTGMNGIDKAVFVVFLFVAFLFGAAFGFGAVGFSTMAVRAAKTDMGKVL